MLPIIIGLIFAVLIAISAKMTGFDRDRSFYAVLLMVIASYYVLFACIVGEAILLEGFIAAVFAIIAITGALRWKLLLSIGLLAHGVFDLLHGQIISNSGVPGWWPAFCASIDIALSLWVLYLVKINYGMPNISQST